MLVFLTPLFKKSRPVCSFDDFTGIQPEAQF